MPALYVVWGGIDINGGGAGVYGIRCSTALPDFEQPQSSFGEHGFYFGRTFRPNPDGFGQPSRHSIRRYWDGLLSKLAILECNRRRLRSVAGCS